MSSWKKAAKVNQKTHRERHQPDSRAHLGILEKKKDYRQRAKDFHLKQARLKSLKKKALSRNPDEFYFHMINSKVQDGEHNEIDKEDEHTPGQIKLMQTQDLKYVNLKCKIESSKIERMQAQLHLIDVANQTSNKHIFFVDSKEEAKNFDVATRLDTHPALMSRRTNRLKLSDLQTMHLPSVDEVTVNSLSKVRNARYKELKKRVEREKELTIIQQKLEVKRHLQNKKEQPPLRIKPGTKELPPVYKWKLERKK
ncbi:probable U3 small nucleolar RNA-associated protein 11 [Hetaerina americana]|uniref:probable U3 small nucleolar RNA-associated protein 11 n=1 Tax=Hetaerina americana TaxID=62018 RepID=UPI003A7F3043